MKPLRVFCPVFWHNLKNNYINTTMNFILDIPTCRYHQICSFRNLFLSEFIQSLHQLLWKSLASFVSPDTFSPDNSSKNRIRWNQINTCWQFACLPQRCKALSPSTQITISLNCNGSVKYINTLHCSFSSSEHHNGVTCFRRRHSAVVFLTLSSSVIENANWE